MTYDDLVQLRRSSNGMRMLSVYLPGPPPDPALKEEPSTLLDGGLSRIGQLLSSASREERDAFLAASEHVLAAMSAESLPRHGAGTAIFADAEGVRHVGVLLDAAPVVVEWRDGIVVVPYLRTLARARNVIVVLIDSRSSKSFRYRDAQLEPIDSTEAEIHTEPPLHMGEAPLPAFHHGVHGNTGADETERRESAAFARMLNRVAHRVENLAQPDGWIVIGGMPQSAQQLVASLAKGLASRLQLVGALTTESSAAEVSQAAAGAVAELNRRRDGVLVEMVLDRGKAGGRASLGWRQTMLALEERAVNELLFSERFVEQNLERAESMAHLAMDGGARVETVVGEGGVRLDGESEGVAAELRYPVPFASLAAAGLRSPLNV